MVAGPAVPACVGSVVGSALSEVRPRRNKNSNGNASVTWRSSSARRPPKTLDAKKHRSGGSQKRQLGGTERSRRKQRRRRVPPRPHLSEETGHSPASIFGQALEQQRCSPKARWGTIQS